MTASRDDAERAHDVIKMRALDAVEAALTAQGVTVDHRDRMIISLAAEAGIVAGIEWMYDAVR